MDLEKFNLHYNTMAVVADSTNWREVTTAIIGEEEVEFKAQDLKRKTPLVRVWSADKGALDRVMSKAAEAGE